MPRSSETVAALAGALAKAQAALVNPEKSLEADAKSLEEAFERKVSTLIGDAAAHDRATPAHGSDPLAQILALSTLAPSAQAPAQQQPTEESPLAISKPRRYRNKDHLRYVARQACLICGRQPSDPHHLRYAQPRALGRKASDEFTVPLCRMHHREVHRVGNEQAWWQAVGIDPLSIAQTLWNKTRVTEGHIDSEEHPGRAPEVTSAGHSSHPVKRAHTKRGRRPSSGTSATTV